MGGHKTISASSYSIPEECMFVNRGDPAAPDFTQATLTLDDNWHDLDLSTIIPAGTQAVLFSAQLKANIAYSHFIMRTKGNVNAWAVASGNAVTTGAISRETLIVAPNANRIVEYVGKNTTWPALTLTVVGWWI